MSIYDFEVKDGEGNMVSLKEYEGKVLLIVNSATKCGFTPQYTELNEIYAEFNEQGFEILDFPCNQFGSQAPGSTEEITEVCRNKWLVPYSIFEKIDVNGEIKLISRNNNVHSSSIWQLSFLESKDNSEKIISVSDDRYLKIFELNYEI